MAEETGNVTEAVAFVSVNSAIIVPKRLFEAVIPDPIQLAKSFADETIERRIGSLLRTTLDNHVAELDLGQRLLKVLPTVNHEYTR